MPAAEQIPTTVLQLQCTDRKLFGCTPIPEFVGLKPVCLFCNCTVVYIDIPLNKKISYRLETGRQQCISL